MKLNEIFKTIIITALIVTAVSAQTLTANGGTRLTANAEGNIGVLYPLVNGQPATAQQRTQFVYEIMANAQFLPLADVFVHAPNGYNDSSPENQYGFWDGGVWLRPVTRDYRFRIGLGSSWIEYELVGNPNAPRPDPNTPGATITLGTPDNPAIAGWDLIWNDEFDGTTLDGTKWSHDIGVGQQGWGNQERQFYTNDPRNIFVRDGHLNIVALAEDRTTSGWATRFTSAKVTTRNRFSYKYGRVDIRTSLPLGQGYWPALWMMPQRSVYGGWASSGEIDIMEAKGRFPRESSGAIHYGGPWPRNTYIHGDYNFPAGGNINQFNVYTLIWEETRFSWFVNGNRFFVATSNRWWSEGAPDNPLAPFDQEFYLIMNLAVGGHFDGFREPTAADLPGLMRVDYVRVYKPNEGPRPDPVRHNVPGNIRVDEFSDKSSAVTFFSEHNGHLGEFNPNLYVEYNINVAQAGTYRVRAQTATEQAGRSFAISQGSNTATLNVPNTGGWFNFVETEIPITLQAGQRTIRFTANGAANIRNIRIETPATGISAKTAARPTVNSFAGINNGQISLNLAAGTYEVQLYDLRGKIVGSVGITATNGINYTGLRTDNLGQGVYILNVMRNGVFVFQQRIMTSR